jgi:predicted PurR-regulated permease PerM
MQIHVVNKITLLFLVLLISALFISMISNFLMALLLAGIFSAMAQPIYKKIAQLLRGRRRVGFSDHDIAVCYHHFSACFGTG